MCDVDEADADALLQALQLDLHLLSELLIERGERLIKQQNSRVKDERAGKRDSLLLPAR